MYLGQRVIDNATDISVKVNDWRALTHTFAYTSGNYLYVGSEVPFNNLYFDIGTANAVTGTTVSAQIWWANSWNSAVDVIDETANANGASLSQSGRITFAPDRLKNWDLEDKTADITQLSTFNIYNMYWARFAWSASLTSSMTLKYIGQKFAEDADMFVLYPDLNNTELLQAHDPAKTNWNDQHFAAAEIICNQLIAKQIIWARGQIVDPRRLMNAGIHKAAALIYASFGKAYLDNFVAASKAYTEAINMGNFAIDMFAEGKVTEEVKRYSQKFLSR